MKSGPRERIPESFLRRLLADRYRIAPQEVDREQIRQAGAELCCRYGPVLMVPQGLETNRPVRTLQPEGDARFWKEREDEFRKHGTPGNSKLSAVWSSMGEHWIFRCGSGKAASTSGAEQIFKSLAREAGKGLGGSHGGETWLDWLDAVRSATDTSTGQRLYSKVSSTGPHVVGETRLERMGGSVPAGGLIEFVIGETPEREADRSTKHGIPPAGRAEMRMFWHTAEETIEGLFTSSANLCLELRSLVSTRASGRTSPVESPLKKCDLLLTVPSKSPEAALSAPLGEDCDFTSKAQRTDALCVYTKLHDCSEASLARTARVDPADLSKWKKGLLSVASDKKARIERALKNNEAPTPPKGARES